MPRPFSLYQSASLAEYVLKVWGPPWNVKAAPTLSSDSRSAFPEKS
jgi:hypothetical protein